MFNILNMVIFFKTNSFREKVYLIINEMIIYDKEKGNE